MHKSLAAICRTVLSLLCIANTANAQKVYMSSYLDGNVYSLPLNVVSSATKYSLSGTPNGHVEDLALYGSTVFLAADDGYVYSLDLTQPSNPVQFSLSSIGMPIYAITTSGQTAYLGSANSHIYTLNLSAPSNPVLLSGPPVGTAIFGMGVYGHTLFISGADGNVYSIDLASPSPTPILFSSNHVVAIDGIEISGNMGYMGGYGDGNVYAIDLSAAPGTATIQLASLAPVSSGQLNQIALDGLTAYLPDVNGTVYSIDLSAFPALAPLIQASTTPSPPLAFSGIVFYYLISPWQLRGNNLILSNYLNKYAPHATIDLFTVQTNIENLNNALERAAPTRNAIGTFTAQTTQLLVQQPLNDHLCQNRWLCDFSKNPVCTRSENDPLLTNTVSCKDASFTPWFGIFGGDARQTSQHQTPAFTSDSYGILAAFDYNATSFPQPVGSGVAYVRTHVHEKKGFGHIDIEQGSVFLYGTFSIKNWYVDLSASGGYYHSCNHRRINFPGFSGTAKSNIHGWLANPHLETGYHYIGPKLGKCSFLFGIEPFAMIDWVSSWEHGFKERGTNGLLDFGQKGKWCSLLRNEVGFRFNESMHWNWGILSIREKVSYCYQKAFRTGIVTAYLIGSPGDFTVTTLISGRKMGVGQLELFLTPHNKKVPQFSIVCQGEFGDKYRSNQLIATLDKDF